MKRKQPEATNLPTVVCLKRRGGKVVQDCDVYIGRACNRGGWDLPRSKWANPWSLLPGSNQKDKARNVIEKFRKYIKGHPELMAALPELYGKRLGCWCKRCPSDICHGDVLVDLIREASGSVFSGEDTEKKRS